VLAEEAVVCDVLSQHAQMARLAFENAAAAFATTTSLSLARSAITLTSLVSPETHMIMSCASFLALVLVLEALRRGLRLVQRWLHRHTTQRERWLRTDS
jgi:flagellar biosynthesis protein FliP